jgi:hypothetical protein
LGAVTPSRSRSASERGAVVDGNLTYGSVDLEVDRGLHGSLLARGT